MAVRARLRSGTQLGSRAARPRPGAGEVLARGPACGVCRTDLHIFDGELSRAEAAAGARPPDRRHGGRGGGGGGALRGRRPGRRPLARLDRGELPLLPRAGARTSATTPASPATTSTAATPSWRSPTSASASRSPRAIRRRGGAAALRRADRLPGAAAGRRGRADRLLRLRRLGPHPLPGRRPPGAARLRLHPRGRRRDARPSPASSAPSGRAGPRRAPAGGARRGDRLRPGRRR